jgi:hypothetical protein
VGFFLFGELGSRRPHVTIRKKVPRFFMPISQTFRKISRLWDLGKVKEKIVKLKVKSIKIKNEIGKLINEFKGLRSDNTHRDASFDLCFYYFQTNKEHVAEKDYLEKSCLYLWSYLSSWGMLRGSSYLLKKSPAFLIPLINHLKSSDVWGIDVNNYTEENIAKILKEYENIKKVLIDEETKTKPTDTLVTKIMLGVYGNIPAFDQFFKKGLGVGSVNEKSLNKIKNFYDKHKDEFNQEIKVLDFENEETELRYTKAKLVDMYGFQKGLNK